MNGSPGRVCWGPGALAAGVETIPLRIRHIRLVIVVTDRDD